MPEPSVDPTPQPAAEPAPAVTAFGIASAALGAVAVAALVLIGVLWSGHRGATAEREHQARALQAAAAWTQILINMNADNVEGSLQQLRDGTVGPLNSGFEASIAPYREVVRTLRSSTTGEIESVSVEMLHPQPDGPPGQRSPAPADPAPEVTGPTNTVLVVATSVSENAGGKPATVRWNLRLVVSEVDGAPKISRLESVR